MAVIRNTASALRKGKVGNETYYVSLNKQIVRVAQNDSNYGESASRTQRQQNNRVKWANLVNFYKLSKAWMRKAFETKKSNQTDYNRFMQLNLANSRIYLTKEAAMASSVVVDAFIISQGSLRSINISSHENHWDTDILLGSLSITDTTTVAAFTQAVLEANNWAREGMQISFVSYQQDIDQYGFPVAVCTAYEVTLDTTNNDNLRAYLPEFCSQSDTNGRLGTSSNISVGGFAYVLSQTIGGRTLVSTQSLIENNTLIINQYSSDAALAAATASYGVQSDVFLDSGSKETSATPQPFFITSLEVAESGEVYLPGQLGPIREDVTGALKLTLSAPLPANVTLSEIRFINFSSSTEGGLSNISISQDRLSVVGTIPTQAGTKRIKYFKVVLSSGVFSIDFLDGQNTHE